ncbi:hypothetical protein GCM10012286_82200 [Streptomyces lasiicapitis]|uniref:Secreted protein n=1 Tax=Streptomyces lasiicapitis TaxID=1923961 RepID=A0ABQ2MW29_9ACTN|nr:hypothetical protein GCM10012286_82200 [Streptomyces lasiicapitis]
MWRLIARKALGLSAWVWVRMACRTVSYAAVLPGAPSSTVATAGEDADAGVSGADVVKVVVEDIECFPSRSGSELDWGQ